MRRVVATTLLVGLIATSCGSEEPSPAATVPDPPDAGSPALRSAADSARRQVELGGLRGDLGYTVADSVLNPANTCAAIVFVVDAGAGDSITSTAYMVLTSGRRAADIFPRADAMRPEYLAEWDTVVGDDEWGLLALAPPETDVEDVGTLCGDTFLDEALRRTFAVQIEPE